jgi:hypothetical protein
MFRHRRLTLPAALALALAACSSTSSQGQSTGTAGAAGAGGSTTTHTASAPATGCVASYPDAGTSGDQCAVEWTCNSGTQTYEIACQLADGNYDCQCSSSTSSTQPMVTVNPFSCSLNGGALVAANACGYMLEM